MTWAGQTEWSEATSITFQAVDGTYPYSIFNSSRTGSYLPSPSSGNLTVSGGNVSQLITFSPTMREITFSENGLPAPFIRPASVFPLVPWSVTLAGVTQWAETSTIVFQEPSGSYSYTVSAIPGIAGFTPSPASGIASVSDQNATVVINYAPNGSPPTPAGNATNVYTFSSNDTPPGPEQWCGMLYTPTGNNYTTCANVGTPVATVPVPNGTYLGYLWFIGCPSRDDCVGQESGFEVVAAPFAQTVVVNGTGGIFSVNQIAVTSSVLFTETGFNLAASDGDWCGYLISASESYGQCVQSSVDTITGVLNGSYLAFVSYYAPGWYYAIVPYSQPLLVAGADLYLNVTFVPIQYPVELSETGLAPGTVWTASLNGTALGGNGTSFSRSLPNGTYTFSVDPVAGYREAPAAGTITVDGAAVVESLTFTSLSISAPTYPIQFEETGLPSGTLWMMTVNGTTGRSATTTLTFFEVNGTYPFNVGSVAGYTANMTSGSVTVDGTGRTLMLEFGPSSSSSGGGTGPPATGSSTATPPWLEWVFVASALAVGVVVGAVATRRRAGKRPGPPQGRGSE